MPESEIIKKSLSMLPAECEKEKGERGKNTQRIGISDKITQEVKPAHKVNTDPDTFYFRAYRGFPA